MSVSHNSLPQASIRPVAPLGIVAAELTELLAMIEGSAALEPGLVARLRRIQQLASGLDPYIAACTTPESQALAALAERTRAEPWPDRFATGHTAVALEAEMRSGHVEGQFLKTLVRATGAKHILEIGLFTGYSALAMAEALPADGRLVALELDPFVANFARESLVGASGDRITIEVGPALHAMQRLAGHGESFDLIFIDADKAGYADYVATILDHGLLRTGGLICVDNTLMQGQPYLPEEPSATGRAIADFNRRIADDPRVEQVILPLRDGLTLIHRV
ncbi:O-methyltransferase [Lichenicoccus sp.]|uniref:O-methyltransferase n=1 Tax=Lichenicoccus sp. TaxID=2781899 RepID=UPI003D0BBB49